MCFKNSIEVGMEWSMMKLSKLNKEPKFVFVYHVVIILNKQGKGNDALVGCAF